MCLHFLSRVAWQHEFLLSSSECYTSLGSGGIAPAPPLPTHTDTHTPTSYLARNTDCSVSGQRVAAAQVGITEQEAELRLRELANLVPGIKSRIAYMDANILVGFLRDPSALAMCLITLKQIFPGGDPAQMLLRQPSLALSEGALEAVQEAADRLRRLLPSVDVDKYLPCSCSCIPSFSPVLSWWPVVLRPFALVPASVQRPRVCGMWHLHL